MPDYSQKPDNAFIDSATHYYEDMWRETHDKWRELDSFYNRDFSVWNNATDSERSRRPGYRPSKPTNIINHAADTQMSFTPKVHRGPVGRSQTREADADKLEPALAAILIDSAMQETDHPWKAAGKYLIHYGYVVFEGPFLEMGGGYEHDENCNPIRIRVPNPAHVLLDPTEREPSFAIKRSTMPAYRAYELSMEKKRTRKNAVEMDMSAYSEDQWQEIEVTECWSSSWHAVKVPEQGVLYVERNTLGFVPFTQGFAGFGMNPVSSSKKGPAHMAQGMLDPVMDTIRLQAQARTAKHQILMDNAFAPLVTTQDPQEIAAQMAQGDVLQGDPNDFRVLPMQQVQQWMFEVDREYDADMEEGTFNRSLGGFRQPGVTTVGQQAILSGAARQKFNLPGLQLEYCASIIASRVLQLVDKVDRLKGAIGGQGQILRKSWIKGNYNAKVVFEVIDPVLDLQRRQLGLQEVSMNLKDYETYWEEDAHVTNVSERWKRLDRQMARTNPAVAAKFAELAAEEIGIDDLFEGEEEAQTGPPVNGGTPANVLDRIMNPGTENEAVRQLRQPLTDQVAKPGPVPPEALTGGGPLG